MIKRAIIFLVLLLVLRDAPLFCKEGKPYRPMDDTSKLSKEVPGGIPRAIQFRTFSYNDKQGIGMEAFRMLIPSDWEFNGGIRWILDNPGMPAVAGFRVRNPNGTEELEVFPNQPFFWTNNQMLLSTFPIGSRYFGNEVHPTVDPLEALKKIVIPRFKREVKNLRIINEKFLPDLAKLLGVETQAQPGISTSAKGAMIKIEYQQDGKWMEEEIYGMVESFSFQIQTMSGMVTNINWVVDYLFSFKAEKGKLDSQSKVFKTMVHSFILNPQWYNKYNQVVEFLIQNQIRQIQNIGHLSKIISQTSNDISDMMMKSYNQRQAVYDRISTNFSQYMRGVDAYHNPIEQKSVELPSGYRNAWTNSLGEYILSDDSNFNPNIGSTKNWQMMKKKE